MSKNTGEGSLSLHQGIFPTQESNQGFLNCRQILCQLSYQESPYNPIITFFLLPLYCSSPLPSPYSLQFSHSVVSDSLWPHEPQHARPTCPSPTPGVHPNPCPLSWWCHPTASGSIQMSQLFTSGGQRIGVSASTSVLPMNTQDWSPLGWTGWISLQSKGLSSLLQYQSSKVSILRCSAFFIVQLSHPYGHDHWINYSLD